MNSFFKYIQTNKIVGLAPMDGYTDEPARLLQTKIAKPDVVFTEFVSAEGLWRGSKKLFDPLLYRKEESPIIAQLFGKDAESFYKSAIICFDLGFGGIDINMGCPSNKVVKHGGGASLIMTNTAFELVKTVLKAREDWFRNKVGIEKIGLKNKSITKFKSVLNYCQYGGKNKWPIVSIKTRLGVDSDISSGWISKLAKSGIDLITLHGRTLKQGYSGKADWQAIEKACKTAKEINPKLIFWGNGDIKNRPQAKNYIEKYKVDGVLIGRNSVGNPWVFEDNERQISSQEKFKVMMLHAQIFGDVFPKRSLEHIRTKLLAYTKNFRNAKILRNKLVRVANIADLAKLEEDFC